MSTPFFFLAKFGKKRPSPGKWPGKQSAFVNRFTKKITENATDFAPAAFFCMAERVGFEPTARCRVTGFQGQLLKPLGHLSVNILPVLLKKVKQANGGVRGI